MRRVRTVMGILGAVVGLLAIAPAPALADGGCIGYTGYCRTLFIDMPDGSILPIDLPGFPS